MKPFRLQFFPPWFIGYLLRPGGGAGESMALEKGIRLFPSALSRPERDGENIPEYTPVRNQHQVFDIRLNLSSSRFLRC